MNNLITLDDGLLLAIWSNPAIRSAIPCLQGVTLKPMTRGAGCNSCERPQEENLRTINTAKQCLRSVSPAELLPIFDLLNARQLRFSLRQVDKKMVTVTIRRPDL